MSAIFLSMPSSIDTKNVCFSDIIISHVAQSCRNEDALAAKFITSEMRDLLVLLLVHFSLLFLGTGRVLGLTLWVVYFQGSFVWSGSHYPHL